MAFLEDPRLRQRWNQIAHDAEAATENAAAGIWSFQHHYINPCFGSVADSFDRCTAVCFGDAEDRLRRRRERDRARGRAEYSFDFYDDWHEEESEGGGMLGSWGVEDWDRLLAGTGSQRRPATGNVAEQPRRTKGMSYGTRGGRRKSIDDDPTIIPSTQPIGFLGKLPWKMGGTLRYKPSAADLQEHPTRHGNGETEPLLGSDDESDFGQLVMPRKRSGTTGSGDTSDSYRSRGDLFPSDGEGEEDAVPLADEVTFDMIGKDDRSSGKSGKARSSKGKRPVDGFAASRTASRTTIDSNRSRDSSRQPSTPDVERVLSLRDLRMEEQRAQQEEDQEVARKKEAAKQLAAEMGLDAQSPVVHSVPEPKPEIAEDEVYEPEPAREVHPEPDTTTNNPPSDTGADEPPLRDIKVPHDTNAFIPARLPRF